MLTLGASNKFFYYNQAYRGTFNIRFRLIFNEDIKLDELKEAATEAIKRYPELGGETVIKDGLLTSLENDRPVKFYEDNGERYDLGSDDTNGYMFYFLYGKDYIILSYYHGLTDIVGIMAYTKTMLYLYAKKINHEMSEEELNELLATIRDDDGLKMGDDLGDIYDPYRTHMNEASVPSYKFDNPGAFSIPSEQYPEDCDYVHATVIELNTGDFIKKTKEYGVSFVPLLTDIISGAISKKYNADRPVIAMVPVNLRPYYNSASLVNFSDGVMVPYYQEDEKLSVLERCQKNKEMMKLQMQKENFDLVLANKVKAVDGYEKLDETVFEIWSRQGVLPKKGTIRPITYAMTYPGKIDFSTGLNRLIKDYFMEPVMRAYATIVYTFGDTMRILCMCRQDEEDFAKCIYEGITKQGLDAKYINKGHVYADQVKLERIKNI